MLGFVFAAIVVNYFAGILTWRFAFQVQAVCELPIAILFFFQDNSKVDVLADTKDLSPSVDLFIFICFEMIIESKYTNFKTSQNGLNQL